MSMGNPVARSGKARREVPRMVKNRAGVSFKEITVAAILGEENQHLPTYLDKIRPTEQVS